MPHFESLLSELQKRTPNPIAMNNSEESPAIETDVESYKQNEALKTLRQGPAAYEIHRFGMPQHKFNTLVHERSLQESFQQNYGISFQEYLTRVMNGEMMGASMLNGRFSSAL